MGKWNRTDIQVTPVIGAPSFFGGVSYDLSATVGANQAVVALLVESSFDVVATPTGVVGLPGNPGIGASGRGMSSMSGSSGVGGCQLLLGITNAAGDIEIWDPGLVGGAATVKLVGYFVPQRNTPVAPGVYNISDIDGIVPKTVPGTLAPTADPSLVFVEDSFIVGGGVDTQLMTTRSGDVTTVGGGGYCGSSAYNIAPTAAPFPSVCCSLTEVASDGLYQVQVTAGGGGPYAITPRVMCAEEEYYVSLNQSVAVGFPLTVLPMPIDLTSWVGPQDCLVILRVTSQSIGGQFVFGPFGMSWPYATPLPTMGLGCSGASGSPGDNAIIAVPAIAGKIWGTAFTGPIETVDIDIIGYVSSFPNLPPSVARFSPSGNVVQKTYPGTLDVDLIDNAGAGIDVSSIEVRRIDSVGNSRVIWSGSTPGSGVTGRLYEINDIHGLGPIEVHIRIDWDKDVLLDGERCTIEIDATNGIGRTL